MTDPIVHLELAAEDRGQLARFYQENFGWEVQEFEEMNYTTFSTGEGNLGGGFNPVTDDNPAGTIVPYISVDDINASLEKVTASGGTDPSEILDIPGVGLIAHFTDPSGNRMALLQPAEME